MISNSNKPSSTLYTVLPYHSAYILKSAVGKGQMLMPFTMEDATEAFGKGNLDNTYPIYFDRDQVWTYAEQMSLAPRLGPGSLMLVFKSIGFMDIPENLALIRKEWSDSGTLQIVK